MTMDKVNRVVTVLSSLTLQEARDLTRQLEAHWDVSAAPQPPFPGTSNPPSPFLRQEEFAVVLAAAGPRRIEVIKVVREALGLSLVDARNLVDAVPRTVRDGLLEAEAKGLAAKLTAAGATVEVR
jgi:large subunit ribosomal protein L7/L12